MNFALNIDFVHLFLMLHNVLLAEEDFLLKAFELKSVVESVFGLANEEVVSVFQ